MYSKFVEFIKSNHYQCGFESDRLYTMNVSVPGGDKVDHATYKIMLDGRLVFVWEGELDELIKLYNHSRLF